MPMDEASTHVDDVKSAGYVTPSAEFLSPASTATHYEKEALMRMMAQEMAKAFVDPNDTQENDEALQDRLEKSVWQQQHRSPRKTRKRSKPQLNIPISPADCGDSFFGLTLEAPSFGADRPPRKPNRSTGDSDEAVNVQDKAERRAKEKAERRVSNLSKSPNRTEVTSTDVTTIMDDVASIMEDDLSMSEIRNYVMSNIPEAVREQIPEAAWARIFDGQGCVESSGVSRKSLEASPAVGVDTSDPKHFSEGVNIKSVPDDVSFMSGLTSAFPDGKSVESKRFMLSKPTSKSTRPTALIEDSDNSSTTMSLESDAKLESARSKKSQRPKGVAFDHIEVRYYERIPTDNPAVLNGPAIGLGWRYKRGGPVKVDFWEDKRGTPLRSWELVMDRKERENILTNAGFSKKEVAEIVRLCLKGKNQRQQTVNNLQMAGVEEAVEKAQRRMSRMMSFGKSKSIFKL